MNGGVREPTKRRWVISGLIALGASVLVVMLFRVPATPLPPPAPTQTPPVRLDVGQTDEVTMRDLEPLFLPTPFNAAPAPLARREPGQRLLGHDEVKLKFSQDDPELQVPAAALPPGSPVAALQEPVGPLAYGMGRTNASVPVAPAHAAYVEVFPANGGAAVLHALIPPDAGPPVTLRQGPDWRPLEFMAAVDPAGLVGSLVLTTSSGREEIDNFFRNYLARGFRVGDRLNPGFYRIVVGP